LRGREIEAAFVTHHDLKEAFVARQADGRLFYGRMLRRVGQEFPHRTKEQDGATARNGIRRESRCRFTKRCMAEQI
jgi:hypothetical protein